MTRSDHLFLSAVARRTGESLGEVRRRGFQPLLPAAPPRRLRLLPIIAAVPTFDRARRRGDH